MKITLVLGCLFSRIILVVIVCYFVLCLSVFEPDYIIIVSPLDKPSCFWGKQWKICVNKKKREKDLFAMIRQLGNPIWFCSKFSAEETRWSHLLKTLGRHVEKKDYTS